MAPPRSHRPLWSALCPAAVLLLVLLLPTLAEGTGHATAKARLNGDPDHDRLSTRVEIRHYKTNPRRFDTDGDGFGDGAEVRAGSNPRNPKSRPVAESPPSQDPPSSPTPPTPPNPPSPPAEGAPPTEGSPPPEEPAPPPAEEPAPPAEEPAPPPKEPAQPCTQNLAAGANLSTAIANAPGGAVICLPAAQTSFSLSQVNKSAMVTIRGGGGNVGYSALRKSSNLRFEDIRFVDGLELLGATHDIEILDSDFTGNYGIHAGGEAHTIKGSKVSNVLIEGNDFHGLDFSGAEGVANGYGITASDGVSDFTIRDNTIREVANDYIQAASPVSFTVEGNTFLGPSLRYGHSTVHQDLWQIFGGGSNIVFKDNVARNTGTHESLLFQEGKFSNVSITNNLFVNDSDGYTCQLYQSSGLVFRNNTIVDSHWGCLFRDLSSSAAGSGYQVDHNVFVGTEEGADISTEGRAGSWGTYDYNVSEDGSAGGSHSVRNWKPSWTDATNYVPAGLPFAAGFRP